MFRATYLTSILAGIGIGVVLHISEREAWTAVIPMLVFFIAVIFCVVGIPQFRETNSEMRRRNQSIFHAPTQTGDFKKFYVPAWLRMLTFFACTAGTTFVLAAAKL